MRRKLFLIVLFLCYGVGYSQQPIAIQLTEKDKLPDNEFYDIFEAKDGMIWLAADKGLFHYNGKSFVNYTHPDKRGLSVFGLYQDDQNRIWCNNISGQFFYVSGNKLELFIDLKDDLKGQLPEFLVHNNTLFVFFEKGVYKVDIVTKQKKLIQDEKKQYSFYTCPAIRNGEIYFSLANSVKKIKADKIQNEFSFNQENKLPKNTTLKVAGGNLFFTSLIDNKQYFHVKKFGSNAVYQKIKTPSVLIEKPIIRTLFIDNLFWFCTNEGVYIAQLSNNQLIIKQHYFVGEACSKVVKDQNNNYWVTTLNNGIYVLPNIAIQKIEIEKKYGLIKDLEKIDNQIIFGTTKGTIGILNTLNNQLKSFSLPTPDEVSELVYEPSKKVLFISQKNSSYIWNLANATLQACGSFTASKGMFYDSSGILLNASFDRANVTFNPFDQFKFSNKVQFDIPKLISQNSSFQLENLRMKRAYTSFIDAQTKNKYVGFVDNLICFDSSKKETIITYKGKPIFALDIVQSRNGIIWVATFENGIIGIKNNKAFINLTQENGLLSNQIGKLKVDDDNLWITSNKGIQKYHLDTKSFENISSIDGFDNYEITDLEIINHQLYISSNKGIFVIDSKQCFKKLLQPKIYFTEFTINEEASVLKAQYDLAYDKNAIKIAFNVNGFQTSQNINYSYRLKGFDNRWTTLENGIDFVRFSSLPAGNYQFEVKAKYVNGTESKPIHLDVLIKKPFWQTWWFYILVSLVVIGVFWLYFKRRFARLEKEKNILLEKTQMDKELIFYQLENLRSQMNPHFIFNALNSIQEYIVTNEKVNASAYLVKFSKLIRLYLEHSRENEVQLEDEIKALQFYLELEKDRFEDTLNFEIIVDQKLNLQTTKVPSLFIQPYVENAIKHGLLHKKENRLLQVNFGLKKDENILECIIEDNGVGRKASSEINKHRRELHKSFATSANEKRVDLINKTRTNKVSVHIEDLEDENQMALGTRVIICVPLQ
ncbi:MAG: histidine kinase [Limnohabitans sp.]|nr:histidine kinase [Limnohabitans sp.]